MVDEQEMLSIHLGSSFPSLTMVVGFSLLFTTLPTNNSLAPYLYVLIIYMHLLLSGTCQPTLQLPNYVPTKTYLLQDPFRVRVSSVLGFRVSYLLTTH
jgi:hypothetical protein